MENELLAPCVVARIKLSNGGVSLNLKEKSDLAKYIYTLEAQLKASQIQNQHLNKLLEKLKNAE